MSADRDLRARVVWACPALSLAKKALYDLLRRLEAGGDGAIAGVSFLAECLALAPGTVSGDRWELRQLGLLEVRQPSRRQAGTWRCTLPPGCVPRDGTHPEILRCAALLGRWVRVHPTVRSESSPGSEVSEPETSPESSLHSEPRVHPAVNTTTECTTQRDTEDTVRAGGAPSGARPAGADTATPRPAPPTAAETAAMIAALEARAAAATDPNEREFLEKAVRIKRRRLVAIPATDNDTDWFPSHAEGDAPDAKRPAHGSGEVNV